MNKSQRIKIDINGTGTTSNYLQVQLEQNIDTLEFLSMSINSKDLYQDFNADYGVLIGRVIGNGGVGIPNAKISVFIPLSEEDENNSEVSSLYPYKTPTDKNYEGKRYNLLPRVAKTNPNTGLTAPKQPFGSFPIKEEIVVNEPFMNVYKKYYKYTALTNQAGDYMIFGAPVGVQTVHMSVDITDIGKYSMTPAAMVTNLGYSPNLFTENGTKIKASNDLSDLPNIETQEIAVEIIPFWGDTANFTIGITRQDFRIRSVLSNEFVIFGTAITDADKSVWGANHSTQYRISELFRINNTEYLTAKSKRIAQVTEKIYYYPANVTDARLDAPNNNVDPTKEMMVLDKSEYSVYKRDGDFVFIISCNRNKVITDEFGAEVPVAEDSPIGVFTKFRGFITLTISPETLPMNFESGIDSGNDKTQISPFRPILKFPQWTDSTASQSLQVPLTPDNEKYNQLWRKQHKIFTGGKIYSIAQFYATAKNDVDGDSMSHYFPLTSNKFFKNTWINYLAVDPNFNVGGIITGKFTVNGNTIEEKDQFEFPSNGKTDQGVKAFGANWLNFCAYFIQNGYLYNGYAFVEYVRTNDFFHWNNKGSGSNSYNTFYEDDNTQSIVAGEINTKWFPRSDFHWTDIIEIDPVDITKLNEESKKGFVLSSNKKLPSGYELKGKYRNGSTPCPLNGGKVNANPQGSTDTNYYLYKGLRSANCIEFIRTLGII